MPVLRFVSVLTLVSVSMLVSVLMLVSMFIDPYLLRRSQPEAPLLAILSGPYPTPQGTVALCYLGSARTWHRHYAEHQGRDGWHGGGREVRSRFKSIWPAVAVWMVAVPRRAVSRFGF